jgi:hypothetical protein
MDEKTGMAYWYVVCVISGFRCDVHMTCVLLWYCAAFSSVPTFRGNLSVPSSRVKNFTWTSWPLKMGPIICPERWIHNYYSNLRNIPEDRRSQNPCAPKKAVPMLLRTPQILHELERHRNRSSAVKGENRPSCSIRMLFKKMSEKAEICSRICITNVLLIHKILDFVDLKIWEYQNLNILRSLPEPVSCDRSIFWHHVIPRENEKGKSTL